MTIARPLLATDPRVRRLRAILVGATLV